MAAGWLAKILFSTNFIFAATSGTAPQPFHTQNMEQR
jgi:hypothetical protein